MFNVIAYQVANAIQIRETRLTLTQPLLFSDSDELFYQFAETKFVYIFQYGMMSFFNMTPPEISEVLTTMAPFFKNPQQDKNTETVLVKVKPKALSVEFETVIIPEVNPEMVRLIMLNTAQSVALSTYYDSTEELLVATNQHTLYLENKGKLDISGHKLKRFIGKTLNIKNRISENLYIFDSPDITWEDEQLNKLNAGLKQTFDLKDRYHLIHDRLDIIKENLDLFKDIMDHKESARLEWIIIILILVEVVDMFVMKLLL